MRKVSNVDKVWGPECTRETVSTNTFYKKKQDILFKTKPQKSEQNERKNNYKKHLKRKTPYC
jgi:hypothetical protein